MKILTLSHAPLLVITALMILAAVIDGVKLKVPNWLTLPMIVSGWLLGLAYGLAWLAPADGTMPIENWYDRLLGSLLVTGVGFATLGPAWFFNIMGAGDVKMQMGWGSWIGAFFGARLGLDIWLYGFVVGVLVGGVMGMAMMLLSGRLQEGMTNLKSFFLDLMYAGSVGEIQARGRERKKTQFLLPYGIPLGIGFVGYLLYYLSI